MGKRIVPVQPEDPKPILVRYLTIGEVDELKQLAQLNMRTLQAQVTWMIREALIQARRR